MKKIRTAVIGGSGLYEIDGVKIIEERAISTPWGEPSDKITIAEIEGVTAAFLPRHGKGHRLLPHELNYRANIAALKIIGVEQIFAFSAVGSLREEIKPLDFVIPDQVIDRTKSRISTFFGGGVAAHVGFGDPFCGRLRGTIAEAAAHMPTTVHQNGTLICMEGPAFSTRAESNLYRSWGASIINMSTLPEAKLAREAEICYAVVCMSTDYDCWKVDEEHVTIEMVINNINTNSAHAKSLIKEILKKSEGNRDCGCGVAAKYAIITAPEKRDKAKAADLKTIFPDYF
jgi:5'-methylthioadenosine phosphorylase